MEVILLWLDELDDLVFGLALLWEPLRRLVLSIGFGAALVIHFSTPPGVYDLVLTWVALTSVVVWLVALLTLVPRGGKGASPAAA